MKCSVEVLRLNHLWYFESGLGILHAPAWLPKSRRFFLCHNHYSFLKLVELLDGLSCSGKDTENVEADLECVSTEIQRRAQCSAGIED